MIMVGFAWQRGVIPVSSRALYRAIKLNGVDAEANLQAFELGRRVAHDPTSIAVKEDKVATPETMPLDDLIAHRIKELTAYQNAAYAQRYADKVAKVRAAEAGIGGEALTRAAAVNLYKLMAYKDEYEVARLYTDGSFQGRAGRHLQGRQGQGLALAAAAGPQGAGRQAQEDRLRRLDARRRLPDDGQDEGPARRRARHLRLHRGAQDGARPDGVPTRRPSTAWPPASPRRSLPLAVKIAEIPQQIRGYGHVKDASVVTAKAAEAKLWAQWGGS